MSLLLMLWFATTVLPKNAILVKGAAPSASDASTPVPEQGSIAAGRYRNAYFGLTYPIPAGWIEQPAGPHHPTAAFTSSHNLRCSIRRSRSA